MKNTIKAAAIAVTAALAGPAFAADLMVTPVAQGNSTQLKFEFVNDESAVSALEFDIKLEGYGNGKIETANCTSGIFTNHSGSCSYNVKRQTLTVIVFSPENAALPTFELGSVTLGAAPSQISSLKVEKLVLADVNGKVVSSGSLMLDNSLLRNAVSKEELGRFSAK